MDKDIVAFQEQLTKSFQVDVSYALASALYAFVEQKSDNRRVNEGRRTGQCQTCGGKM